ncbi:MAG: hypothetical protein VXW06_06350, partial [Pseudomonadota bacterium]|nr:hypothetical protein [Pseudomonadota bacterium]
KKTVDATLPANHPKKELANKKTKFICKITNVKKSKERKIDDDFAPAFPFTGAFTLLFYCSFQCNHQRVSAPAFRKGRRFV